MFVVALTSCGGNSKAVGSYKLESVTDGGETITAKDFEEMAAAMGQTIEFGSLVLNGTGTLVLNGESVSVTWDEKAIYYNGDAVSYTLKDNTLTLGDDKDKAVFVKETK